ncbi:TPA: Holliday junction resolvase RuvX [Candidatus Dependentiae bacterium]|nr:MAG: hypothetical protein UR14_C0008G0047 [candidate division TM6 bacterium GW2011_GWE2_31_21]KKP53227.1 MAG: hypothetical protein UR43_C0006G0010 [candidate division TM6 bacterium GW2011_GWF2_33_332]HBS48074.1 Holliday junction resolvase RuvX [Candidatus Dependentiae bacterium]HBZ73323.1 Holliday junction resolvase RuvX [Candidatus Dependentiae bacterium]
MKTLALDIGDKWVGSALSDAIGLTCKPYKTVSIEMLNKFLEEALKTEPISTVVVGYPKTLKGNESDQTKKTVQVKEKLETIFAQINGREIKWVLWDERLSSKRAGSIEGRKKGVDDKLKEHSIAAAFILQTFLDFKSLSF